MATVTEILDRAALLTGLQKTDTTSAERTLALQALQDTYNETVEECDLNEVDATVTISTSQRTYDIASDLSLTDVYRIKHIRHTSAGRDYYLRHRAPGEEMEFANQNLATGLPQIYATKGITGLRFFPQPGSGETMEITYIGAPPVLVESAPSAGEEATPSLVTALWHWRVLLPGLVVQMLDKDQRSEEAAFWQTRYDAGKSKLKVYSNRFGGSTPRVYLEGAGGVFLDKDRHIRGAF